MIQNKIQFVVDETGRHLRVAPFGSLRAFTDAAAVIELVTPFPPESYVEIAYNVYDSRDIRLSQFLLPTIDKGADVISPSDGLYQKCADWSVFRVSIKATALTYIAKFRAGRVGVAFNISDFVRLADMVTYRGEFGAETPWPKEVKNGDYCICNSYNYYDKGQLWNKGSAAYYKNYKWNKAGRKARMTTATLDIPVDASVLADAPQISEDDYNRIIAQLGADIAALNESKQRRLCTSYGLNLSPGEDCDVISLSPPVDIVAGMRALPIQLADWIDGEIRITPLQHGLGNNPNLIVSTIPLNGGETYDSPEVDANGNITLRADVPWAGKVLIAGGVAEKGDIGPQGPQGVKGDKPAHEWSNTQIRFETPTGEWGNYVDLKGEKGDTGEGFSVAKVFSSVQEMIDSEGAGLIEGDFVLIETGNVDDPDNAKLYVYEGDGAFGYLTDLSGAQGIKGEKGDKGEQGIQGEQGDKGDPSTLDKIGINATIIDLSDIQVGTYGTVDNPIEITENSTISFVGYTPTAGYLKKFELYVKRVDEYAVEWSNMGETDWAYSEIPILPVGKVQLIMFTTSNGVKFYGSGGDSY